MQGDQLRRCSGAHCSPALGRQYSSTPLQPCTGCMPKVTPLCTPKQRGIPLRRATVQSVHSMQRRSFKDQAGTLKSSSAMACSSSPVDCHPVDFALNFHFFSELRRTFYLQLQQHARVYHHKSCFQLVRWLFSRLIVVLPGIKTLVKAFLWYTSRLNNHIFMPRFGPMVERWTKAAILAGYNALAIFFASDSCFLKNVN